MLPKFTVTGICSALLSSHLVLAEYEAHWVRPSSWYGVDGNWSSILVFVGDGPTQGVELLVSTVLAESWVVSIDACPTYAENPDGFFRCERSRGHLFNSTASRSWNPLGLWTMGVSYLGIPANAEYGVDGMALRTQNNKNLFFRGSSVASVTELQHNNGFFGLGIIGTLFGQKVAVGPIDAMAKISRVMKSRSYGYTAGAHYALDGRGSPQSLTLGGYDENRFEGHEVEFDMHKGYPVLMLRGIETSMSSLDDTLPHSTPSPQVLMKLDEHVDALVDTTTPHLWLPPVVCDRFAQAFSLTWNSELGYYFFSSSKTESQSIYNEFRKNRDVTFKFTLSDYNNNNLFDNEREVVNVTVPLAAFTSLLRYPLANLEYGDESLPYFMLKRAESNNSKVILGRSFMQEIYLRAKYDPPTFSVHQAKFPTEPEDTKLVTIENQEFPLAEDDETQRSSSLSASALAGIVFAVCASLTVIVAIWYCRRRKSKATQRAGEGEEAAHDAKDSDSDMETENPKTMIVLRMLSVFSSKIWKKPKGPQTPEPQSGRSEPVEVAADEDHERFEMPVPVEPVELDGDNDRLSVNGTTEFGTEGSGGLTPYEISRKNIERQLQGPIFASIPPPGVADLSEHDVALAGHSQPLESPSPLGLLLANNTSGPMPSPLSPNRDWQNREIEPPSPVAVSATHLPASAGSSATQSSRPASAKARNPPSSLSRSNSLRSFRSPPSTRQNRQPSLPSLTETQTRSRTSSSWPTSPASHHSSGSSQTATRSPQSPLSPTSHNSTDHSPIDVSAPLIQRTPIDSSRVVCLGPLPDNVQLPAVHQPQKVAHIARVGSDGQSLITTSVPMCHPEGNESVDTLGSNYTEEEAATLAELNMQYQQPPSRTRGSIPATVGPFSSTVPRIPPTASQAVAAANARRPAPLAIITGLPHIPLRQQDSDEDVETPRRPVRIDSGLEIVHIPQVAARRYSWEDEGQ